MHKNRDARTPANFGMTRRKLIERGGFSLAAAAVASAFPAPWVRAAKPVKIGYVSPQTAAPITNIRNVLNRFDGRPRPPPAGGSDWRCVCSCGHVSLAVSNGQFYIQSTS